jgi:hypothetical protein
LYHPRLLLGCEQCRLAPFLAVRELPTRCVVLGFKRSPLKASRLNRAQFAYRPRSPDSV